MPVVKFLGGYRGRLTQEALKFAGDTMEVSPAIAQLLLQRGVVELLPGNVSSVGTEGLVAKEVYTPATPASFKVIGIMRVYNEADILQHVIESALQQGIELHIFDNHSTDNSFAIARKYRKQGCVVEKWGSRETFSHEDWGLFLDEYIATLECDWVVIISADEILLPPWRGMTYRDALYYVGSKGYNCVDHAYIDFWATKDGYNVSEDPQQFFTHYEVRANKLERAYRYVEGVKNTGGGHTVTFPGKRVFNQLFILKNYRFRSERQFIEKIAARNERMKAEIDAGLCSVFYKNPPDTYLKNPANLTEWSDDFWLSDLEIE